MTQVHTLAFLKASHVASKREKHMHVSKIYMAIHSMDGYFFQASLSFQCTTCALTKHRDSFVYVAVADGLLTTLDQIRCCFGMEIYVSFSQHTCVQDEDGAPPTCLPCKSVSSHRDLLSPCHRTAMQLQYACIDIQHVGYSRGSNAGQYVLPFFLLL